MHHQATLQFATSGRGTRDITQAVAGIVAQSRVRTGLVHLFAQHTSCSLVSPRTPTPTCGATWTRCSRAWHPTAIPPGATTPRAPDDMAAHARTVLSGESLTVPLGDGRMLLGTWQGLFLWEHRTEPQHRSVVVTVLGE